MKIVDITDQQGQMPSILLGLTLPNGTLSEGLEKSLSRLNPEGLLALEDKSDNPISFSAETFENPDKLHRVKLFGYIFERGAIYEAREVMMDKVQIPGCTTKLLPEGVTARLAILPDQAQEYTEQAKEVFRKLQVPKYKIQEVGWKVRKAHLGFDDIFTPY